MSKSNSILILLLVAAIVGKQVAGEPPTKPNYFRQNCRKSVGNYTTNSMYETNLRSVLFDLQGRASTASFSNTSVGSGEDQVYGQYYCRGDIELGLCHDCIQQATLTVFQNCSNFKAAVVWYLECTLRYQNISMVGMESEVPNVIGSSPANVSDPDTFNVVIGNTMGRIINESASAAAHFATGEGVVSQFVTVYCLVQCSPDLNGTQCDTCLRSAYVLPQLITPQGIWPQFAYVFYPSCQMRYSTDSAFYPLSNQPPPPPSLPPPYPLPPAPVVATSPPKGGAGMLRTRDSMTLGIVITAIAFFMFQARLIV